MSRWSARRGQTEPLAALVAVFAVCVAVSTYAVGLSNVLPTADSGDRDVAEPTLDRVVEAVRHDGVVDPENISAGVDAAPEGYSVRVTLTAGNDTWVAGPDPPETAGEATERVGVRRWPGRVDPGRLTVEVWT